jgi:hypothetical protein
VFLLPKDECPPPPQTDSSVLSEEKEMERLAKEIERDEVVWSTRELMVALTFSLPTLRIPCTRACAC